MRFFPGQMTVRDSKKDLGKRAFGWVMWHFGTVNDLTRVFYHQTVHNARASDTTQV